MEKEAEVNSCPLEGVIDVIGRKWALLIINVIGSCGKTRFGELMKQLQIVSPKTVSDTLKQLQKEDLVHRESFAEIPPRVEYSLTEDGKGLWKAILPILKWTAKRGTANGRKCSHAHCILREQKTHADCDS